MTTVVRGDCFTEWNTHVAMGSVDLIVCDPPYGGILKEGWDKTWTTDNMIQTTELIEALLKPGGTAYVWGGIGKPGNRLFFKWLASLEEWTKDGKTPFLQIWDVITWKKRRFYGTANRYGFAREECAMLVKGDKPKTFNIPLLGEKRGYPGYSKKYPAKSEYLRRTNVWDDVTEIFRNKIHPAQKPTRLAEIMIETSSNPGDLVVDLFAGSGSTGVAAKKLGRECILFEKTNCRMLDEL